MLPVPVLLLGKTLAYLNWSTLLVKPPVQCLPSLGSPLLMLQLFLVDLLSSLLESLVLIVAMFVILVELAQLYQP